MPTHSNAQTLLLTMLLGLLMFVFAGCEKVHTLNLSDAMRVTSEQQNNEQLAAVDATVRHITIRLPLSMSISQESSTAACRINRGDSIPTDPDADVIHLMFDATRNNPELDEGDRVRFWFDAEGRLRRFTRLEQHGG